MNSFELEHSFASTPTNDLEEPVLAQMSYVYFDEILAYTQFIKSIELPPKIA